MITSTAMRIPTMVTLGYERERWGALRIVLDGISNHLDAVGTLDRVAVTVAPESVVISDDGPGYDAALLGLLYSTKAGDERTIGQFGEGVKLIAAAALREGLHFSVASRDWRARATTEPIQIELNGGAPLTVERLVWEIEPRPWAAGSVTTISCPDGLPADLVAQFSGWQQYFLQDDHRSCEQAWRNAPARLFVKGAYVKDLPEHNFSYNLVRAQLSRDRDTLDTSAEVAACWARMTDTATLAELLRCGRSFIQGEDGARGGECTAWIWPAHPEAWRAAFQLAFGEHAVLATRDDLSHLARQSGYLPVVLPKNLVAALSSAGVQTDERALNERIRYAFRALRPEEAEVVERARAIVARLDASGPYPVYAMEQAPPDLNGVALLRDGVIGIRADRLTGLAELLPVYLEEHAHLASGCWDCTRGFQTWLVELAARALGGGAA